jgi:hypothetical protein
MGEGGSAFPPLFRIFGHPLPVETIIRSGSAMLAYILRRIMIMIPTLLGVTIIVFLMLH